MTRSRDRSLQFVLAALLPLLTPSAALSQAPAVQPQAQADPAAQLSGAAASTPFTAGWQNGFALQSVNGDNRLQFGAVAQLDGRFSLDDPLPIVNTFTLRKARPVLSGRVAKYIDYRLMAEFGSGAATVLDAFVDLRFSPKFRIRSGKDKTPVGYEVLIGDASLLFPERALASSLLPNRDVGVSAQGDLVGGKVSYAGGVFNGVLDGVSSTTDVDTNSGKDVAGRIVVQPFRAASTLPVLNGLGLQLGGSTGNQTGALPSFRTSAGSQTYFSYAGANGAIPAATASGDRWRVTPAVFLYYKSFGAFGEYVRATQSVTRGAITRDITNQGWEISGSFLLTGEAASTGVPSPKRALDPPTDQWGALQIVARVAELKVDGAAFDAGFASAGSSRRAQAFAVGANWYPAQPVKYYVTFERTVFDGGVTGARPAEDVVLLRVQLAF